MTFLKLLWTNFVAATFGMVGAALVHLLVWGEHMKGAATVWLLLFWLAFTTFDLIKLGSEKIRERL